MQHRGPATVGPRRSIGGTQWAAAAFEDHWNSGRVAIAFAIAGTSPGWRNQRPASRAWWRRAPRSNWSRRDFSSPKDRSARRMASSISPTTGPIKFSCSTRPGKITVAHENTNNANGLALTRDGDLLEVQGVGKRVNKRSRTARSRRSRKASTASRSWRRTICSSTPGAASTSPIRGRGRWCRAARRSSITFPPAPRNPLSSTTSWCGPMGSSSTADGKTLLVNNSLSETFYAYDVERGRQGQEQAAIRQAARHPRGQGKRRRRHGHRSRRPGLRHLRRRRADFRRQRANISAPFRRRARHPTWRSPDRTERTLYITAREGLYRRKDAGAGTGSHRQVKRRVIATRLC